VVREAAVLTLALALTAAAWQDVKTREIDVRIFAAGGAAAAVLMWLNWGNPLYTLSLAVGALLALLTRLSGTGYADSIALALISTAPPIAFLPASFTAVIAGSVLLPATMLWLYVKNRGRPCRMSALEKLTHICVSPEEFAKNPVKYVVGDVKDLEKYDPPMEIKGWVKAKYGLPYVLHLAVGFWVYVALFLTPP
jgi:preflagellin peptidase FlaK